MITRMQLVPPKGSRFLNLNNVFQDDVVTSSTMDEAVYILRVDHPMQLQAHPLSSILDAKNKGCITASHLKVHLRSNT